MKRYTNRKRDWLGREKVYDRDTQQWVPWDAAYLSMYDDTPASQTIHDTGSDGSGYDSGISGSFSSGSSDGGGSFSD